MSLYDLEFAFWNAKRRFFLIKKMKMLHQIYHAKLFGLASTNKTTTQKHKFKKEISFATSDHHIR